MELEAVLFRRGQPYDIAQTYLTIAQYLRRDTTVAAHRVMTSRAKGLFHAAARLA